MREPPHNPSSQPEAAAENLLREIEQAILAAIKSLRYGSVEIIVQDSKVVQIERREKIRFDKQLTKKAR
jgi:hypothetical protein